MEGQNNLSLGLPSPPLITRLYTNEELENMIKITLDSPYLSLALSAAISNLSDIRESLYKVMAPDIYYDKLHIECYNFCQQCKDHFAITGAIGHNRVFFATTFLENRTLNHWQQYRRKINGITLVLITLRKLKGFF